MKSINFVISVSTFLLSRRSHRFSGSLFPFLAYPLSMGPFSQIAGCPTPKRGYPRACDSDPFLDHSPSPPNVKSIVRSGSFSVFKTQGPGIVFIFWSLCVFPSLQGLILFSPTSPGALIAAVFSFLSPLNGQIPYATVVYPPFPFSTYVSMMSFVRPPPLHF